MLCACNTDNEKANISFDSYKANIANFQQYFKEYSNASDNQLNKLSLNKYRLTVAMQNEEKTLESPNIEQRPTIVEEGKDSVKLTENQPREINIEQTDNTDSNVEEKENVDPNVETPTDVLDDQQPAILPNTKQDRPTIVDKLTENTSSNEKEKQTLSVEQLSPLYSLSNDIDNECDAFCELKKQLSSAIVETQNLIDKVNKKEIDLTNEQRMFLTEQSSQLKNLGKRLASVTTELSFSVNDLTTLINSNADTNELAVKYLLILNNLNQGNEMLENSLYSLNMINQLLSLPNSIPGNNYGRILYGFRQNEQPPVIYDYLIDKDGNLTENKDAKDANENKTDYSNDNSAQSEENSTTEQNATDDTKKRTWLTPNIDSYGNFRSNIDTFYNTALWNRYNYGRNYGYGNFYGAPNGFGGYNQGMYNNFYNPNYNQNYNPNMLNNYENTNNEGNALNTTNSVKQTQNTQDIQKQSKKKFKLKRNIDTYKNDNTPTPKQRFAKVKTSIDGFFAKFKKNNKNNLNNPTYNFEENNN